MSDGRWRPLLAGVAALLIVGMVPASAGAAGIGARVTDDLRQSGQGIDVEVDGDVIVGRPVEIEFRASNPASDASQGSITVSLPGNPSVEIVRSSVSGAKVYQPGEQMFNFGVGRATGISVPAVELYISSWPTRARHVLRLRITANSPYSVQARASFRRANGSFVHVPAAGPSDQQGAPTRALDLTPRPPVQPTTPPPPPTATPPPPPTNTAEPPTAIPPTAAPAAEKPEQQQPAAVAPAPPALGPATVTPQPPAQAAQPPPAQPLQPAQPPPAAAAPATANDGPSMPLLLAGFGTMAVGLAIGLVALALVLRRRPDAPPTAMYPPRGRGYYEPEPPYGPGGTGQMPGGQYGGPPYQPQGGPPLPPWLRDDPRQRGHDDPRPGSGKESWPGAAAPRTPPWDSEPAGRSDPPTVDEQPPTRLGPSGGRDRGGVAQPGGSGGPVGGPGPASPTGERYTDRQLMGRGGMGSVYRAYDSRLRRWVALKIMHADLGLQPGFLERFIREAQVAAMLEHPNIVTVYDIEPVGDSIQMVMSWIEGEDLQKILERDRALPVDRAARLLDQMGAALDHAHLREHPVLHRDIKPSNIMIGPNERVILTDFGIARILGDVSLTQTGQIVGTPAFMAPEVIQGMEPDGRADVYALGVVLYQMLTGQAPFRAETPLALLHAQVHASPTPPRVAAPGLSHAVDAVLMQALAKDRARRYQTAGALARAFRAAAGMA